MAKTKTKTLPGQLIFDFDLIEQELFLVGDVHNIKFMLPKLFEYQHEDVSAAEKRFQTGKGYLFTNGTGTGKTYVGLGIAKRFYIQGKKNILIIVPTEKKCIDWIEDGCELDLDIYMLKSIMDKGFDVVITTYANFYQNEALNERKWDLIIYDESHYLNQNEKGNNTVYIDKHKELSNLPSTARQKAFEYPGVYETTIDENGEEVKKINKELFDKVYNELIESTKVVFLSATPFAYHKSIKYADGTLFEIEETIKPKSDNFSSYNEANGFEKFLVENFGYRMKYNKCTIPESGVDINLLERNFFEKFKEMGVMSTRQLELDKDYSREFIEIDSEIGDFIDSGIEMFHNKDFQEKYPLLSKHYKKKFNYLYVNQLLECIKAKEIYKRIQQHLFLDRKVVVFHSYNNANISHPFQFKAFELLNEEDRWDHSDLEIEIIKYKHEFHEYWNLDLSDLMNTRASIKKHFSNAVEFNGNIPKKKRNEYIKEFIRDNSGTDVIIIQQKAGREGISLHDVTGVHQRVLIQLGLPTEPTAAIQIEGRIYRVGLVSNAIYEYITLQTNTERIAFAQKIAERAKTAENLAMGNLARNLELAFKEGYKNANKKEPSLEQGVGGKEADKFLYNITEFDRAKTYYYAKQKRTSKNKSKEGTDYFATPEPLGFKMIEWLNVQPNEKGLEPSAGHGAIARFFPTNTTNHFVEQSFDLVADLNINANGTVYHQDFESLYVGNKFDFIAMNPPFGVGGKTAMEHVSKACRHLNWSGSRLLAIVPNGASMQKRLDEFFLNPENSKYRLTGEILLPTVTFERAGTSVSCKVIRIEYFREGFSNFYSIDLSHLGTIEEFFDEIENLTF